MQVLTCTCVYMYMCTFHYGVWNPNKVMIESTEDVCGLTGYFTNLGFKEWRELRVPP